MQVLMFSYVIGVNSIWWKRDDYNSTISELHSTARNLKYWLSMLYGSTEYTLVYTIIYSFLNYPKSSNKIIIHTAL